MADGDPTMLVRWRNDIQDRDPEYHCMKHHKKSVVYVHPQSRLIILWSFVSLFYIYGDISIGIREDQHNSANEVVVWGIPFVGITETTFIYFIFIMTIYFFMKFIFSIIRMHISCNSWMAFKEMISLSDYDVGWKEGEERYKSPEPPVGISFSVHSEGSPRVTEKKDEEYTDNREMWLFMMRYRLMGFLEYFFAPIIFPAVLAFWALFMLAMEVFS